MKKPGFTLVEVLVATALAAVLSLAVLGVVAGLGRDLRATSKSATASGAPRLWQERLVQTITQDLVNARQVQWTGASGPVIQGYTAVSPQDLAPAGRPVEITYALINLGSQSCLVRKQVMLDEPIGNDPWSELLASGVKTVEIAPLPGPVAPPSGQQAAAPLPHHLDGAGDVATRNDPRVPLPQRVKLRVTWLDPGVAILDRTLVLH